MLRITIDNIRFGNENDKEPITVVEIANITPQGHPPGQGVANYLIRRDGREIGILRRFDRAHGALSLAARALQMIEAQERESKPKEPA